MAIPDFFDAMGFIDVRNVNICADMFNAIGIRYQKTQVAWGFKFSNPSQELMNDIVAHLRVDNTEAKIWPLFFDQSSSSGEATAIAHKVNKSVKPYYDLITLDTNNRQIIREYIVQKKIPTVVSPRGVQAIVVFAVDFDKLDFPYFRHCTELIAQTGKGQYKAAASKALSDHSSGNYNHIDDTKGSKSSVSKDTIHRECVNSLRNAVLKHIDLSLENYPPSLIRDPRMGVKSIQKRGPARRALSNLFNPLGL